MQTGETGETGKGVEEWDRQGVAWGGEGGVRKECEVHTVNGLTWRKGRAVRGTSPQEGGAQHIRPQDVTGFEYNLPTHELQA